MTPAQQLELRCRVGLAVAAAQQAGMSQLALNTLVDFEWRRLLEAEAAAKAGARATERRGPRRGGGL